MIAGVTAATLVVHLGSVVIGRGVAELLPERLVLVIVALSFFVFAAWSLRGDTLDEDEGLARALPGLGAFGVVTASFFVSELGDKTQLATVSLAGNHDSAFGVWIGSTLGMVLADALAIGAGVLAGRRLPMRTISYVAAALFAAFGAATLAAALWR